MRSALRSRPVQLALLVGFILRGWNGSAPLLGTNSWRQCDNAAIARNYLAPGARFALPRVDWDGASDGVVQMEFPLLPWTVSRLYRVLGEHDWLGRWVAILCSLATIPVLAALAGRLAGPEAAGWAAWFAATSPALVLGGRMFAAEAPMLLASAAGLWWFDLWLAGGSLVAWGGAAAALALAGLLKPPALLVGLPLAWLIRRRRGWAGFAGPGPWLFAAVVLGAVAAWYAYSARLLAAHGLTLLGDWRYGTDKWGDWRLVATWTYWNRILFQRLAGKIVTWPGFLLLAWGWTRARDHARLFTVWMIAALVASVIVSKGAYVHEHYQLWFALPAAVLMGLPGPYAARWRFWKSRRSTVFAVLLAGFTLLSLGRILAEDERERPEESLAFRVGQLVREKTEPGAIVLFLDDSDPTDLYHARRHGFTFHRDQLRQEGEAALAAFTARGARYLAGPHAWFDQEDGPARLRALIRRHPVVADDGAAFVLRLGPRP